MSGLCLVREPFAFECHNCFFASIVDLRTVVFGRVPINYSFIPSTVFYAICKQILSCDVIGFFTPPCASDAWAELIVWTSFGNRWVQILLLLGITPGSGD